MPILTAIQTIQRDSSISFPMLGNFSIDPPSYFTVFGRNIYFYGVLIALGFLLAILYCGRRSRDFGIQADDFYDLMLWLIPLSIVGARLYFVLFRLDDYLADPISILKVHEGGLAIYGGVIAGVLCAVFVCRHKKIPLPAMLDLTVLGLLIGQIIGRWGNFMNREAFGAETAIFCRMGLTAPDGTTIYVHPTFLYESLWNLACFVFLLFFTKRGGRRYDGQCALIYFFWYGLGRAWIEGLRTDSLYIGGTGIRVSQLLSLILALAAGTILLVEGRKAHPPEKLYVNQQKETIIKEENENG
ncbi:MAG: prolipoprotein diacylglyceryl transferase [Oscillospiraceae bacterium]|jgi:prolipoprotein diacylglyceryl transferase|nr:prolipoprotein diacylglyceryl transferase [Oscillospiraceae bacterium]